MPDREKVIKALECILNIDGCRCKNCLCCDYREDIDHCEWNCHGENILSDALALLKEQEPRAITAEEMTQIEPDTVYWGEGHHVRNLWPMAFTDEAIEDSDSGFLEDSYGRIYEVELYNKGEMGWRLWTSRPTEEQRKEVPWDEPTEI